LVTLEAGVRLGDEVPVRHRLGIILPGGWSAGGRHRWRLWRLTDVHENPRDGSGLGDEGDDTHVGAAVGTGER